ncbi:hypothetical protein P0L94_01180 [Microbacter sp. GSS18]|nr:hypothetical protein P0L94_01180 [Microbacter sp. GSS18]
MQARGKIIGAIGALAGIALAVTTAIMPATAAKPPRDGGGSSTTLSGVTCSSLDGRTVTASGVSEVVGMKAGETLRVTVSPALTGDDIIMTVALGAAFGFYEAPAKSGISYTAGITANHSFGWSYEAAGTRPSSLTWTFSCSSGGSGGGGSTTTPEPSDADGDGVADSADVCSGTSLPDSVRKAAGSYYANKSGVFVDGNGARSGYTVTDTAGCSAKQIAAELGLKKPQSRYGISLTVLRNWVASH